MNTSELKSKNLNPMAFLGDDDQDRGFHINYFHEYFTSRKPMTCTEAEMQKLSEIRQYINELEVIRKF